jgi:hypothetical protein
MAPNADNTSSAPEDTVCFRAREDRLVVLRKSGDLYFVAASSLVCLVLFFWVIMPKVQGNRSTRMRLQGVVRNTEEILENVRTLGKKTRALSAGDPFFLKASLRWYLELQGRPWAVEGTSDAGDPEPGRS